MTQEAKRACNKGIDEKHGKNTTQKNTTQKLFLSFSSLDMPSGLCSLYLICLDYSISHYMYC